MPRISFLFICCFFGIISAKMEDETCVGEGTCTDLRFNVDDTVLVNMGRSGWKVARIISLHHRESHWSSDQVAPYLVELDQGGMAYVPIDDSGYVREAKEKDIVKMQKRARLTQALSRDAERLKSEQLIAAEEMDISPTVATVIRYHAKSCHVRPGLYASGGQMDWENQPDKFRRILGSMSIDLPQSSISTKLPFKTKIWSIESLGVLLHDAAGLTAWKSQGRGVKYSLRANPSSGALQPLEIYYFGSVVGTDIPHWHYNPYWHSLERIAKLPKVNWDKIIKQLPKDAAIFALTSIVWRNAWKYIFFIFFQFRFFFRTKC
eukprot:GSMAST32.ASY1.ANO1.2281.1 assembled CDS